MKNHIASFAIILQASMINIHQVSAKESQEGVAESTKDFKPHNELLLKSIYYPGGGHFEGGDTNRGYMYLSLSLGSFLIGAGYSAYGLSQEASFRENPSQLQLRQSANESLYNANIWIWSGVAMWGISILDMWLSPPLSHQAKSRIGNQQSTAAPKPLTHSGNPLGTGQSEVSQKEPQKAKRPKKTVANKKTPLRSETVTKFVAEKAAAEKVAAQKAMAEKAEAEKAAAEKAAAEKAATEKAAAEKAAAEKAEAEKAAAEKAAAEKAAAEMKSKEYSSASGDTQNPFMFMNVPSGGFSIQVKAYTSEKPAMKYIKRMSKKMGPLRVQKANKAGKILYRVKLGRFKSRQQALSQKADYKRIMGQDPYITKAD